MKRINLMFAFCLLLACASSAGIVGAQTVNAGSISPQAIYLLAGQSTTLTANPSGGNGVYSYQWYMSTSITSTCSAGTLIPGATAATYNAGPTSTTYYCYVVTSGGNTASSQQAVVSLTTIITPYTEFQNWLPILFLAILLSMMLTSMYYVLGIVLNNSRIKQRAVQELTQAVSTAAIAIIIVGVLAFFGQGIFMQDQPINPLSLMKICGLDLNGQPTNLQLSTSQINFLNPTANFGPLSPSPTNIVCHEIVNIQNNGGTLTDSIDYGLFSNYVILANLTNQTTANLNAIYQFEGWLGFADKFTSITSVCEPLLCINPTFPRLINVQTKYSPYAGYDALQKISGPLETQASLTFYVFLIQLTILLLIMYMWPWIMAAGLILRAISYTRRAGGLLIALALSFLLIYPAIYAFEYGAFQNLGSGPIGATNLPAIPLNQSPINGGQTYVYGATPSSASPPGGYVPASQVPNNGCTGSYAYVYENSCWFAPSETPLSNPNTCATSVTASQLCPGIGVNFFVFPNAAELLNSYGCLPPLNVLTDELTFSAYYLSPFGVVTEIASGLGGLVGQLPVTPSSLGLVVACPPNKAISSVLSLTNLYGIISVIAYILPLFNLIIVLSAAVGISGLIGGDTNILGLGKLL